QERGGHTAPGRGYQVEDASQLAVFGIVAGYIAVLVFALYINSPKVSVFYTNPAMLWLIAPLLLYWISRVWLIARRGGMNEDPIIYAFKDKASYLVGLLSLGLLMAAV
ncbi:MAG: hypothetical protein MI867_21120, partial [Pseudomonadales bacterium]|nr:hypothetical protein [Pseudomonadales bacterium]